MPHRRTILGVKFIQESIERNPSTHNKRTTTERERQKACELVYFDPRRLSPPDRVEIDFQTKFFFKILLFPVKLLQLSKIELFFYFDEIIHISRAILWFMISNTGFFFCWKYIWFVLVWNEWLRSFRSCVRRCTVGRTIWSAPGPRLSLVGFVHWRPNFVARSVWHG